MTEIKTCDVLIVGGGGAGVIAAVEASTDSALRVILASKGPIGKSGLTPTANGGVHTNRSAEDMFREAVEGGCFLNDQGLAWRMSAEIRNDLGRLEGMGIPLALLSPTASMLPPVGALRKLRGVLTARPNVTLMEDVLVTNLFRTPDAVCGAGALDLATGTFFAIQATTVVLATGGLVGDLYPHSSNNPFGISSQASGTGCMMAFEAGADLIDMEMVQFVPIPANPKALHLRFFPDFWASPYRNAAGDIVESNVSAYLDGSYNFRFVQKLHREAEKSGPIWIDYQGPAKQARTSSINSWQRRRGLIRAMGIDPAENRTEILIGSHFGMGGVRVDEQTETTIPGLFAAGEIMGGVHGAMRLSGNSFSQMIVFGFEAGRRAADVAGSGRRSGFVPLNEIKGQWERIGGFLKPKPDPLTVRQLKIELQQAMAEHVFVVRDRAGLEKARRRIENIRDRVCRIQVAKSRIFNLEWMEAIEFAPMVQAADLIARSALAREESRGAHFRQDHPETHDKKWPRHTIVRKGTDRPVIDTAPVVMNRIKPEDLP